METSLDQKDLRLCFGVQLCYINHSLFAFPWVLAKSHLLPLAYIWIFSPSPTHHPWPTRMSSMLLALISLVAEITLRGATNWIVNTYIHTYIHIYIHTHTHTFWLERFRFIYLGLTIYISHSLLTFLFNMRLHSYVHIQHIEIYIEYMCFFFFCIFLHFFAYSTLLFSNLHILDRSLINQKNFQKFFLFFDCFLINSQLIKIFIEIFYFSWK